MVRAKALDEVTPADLWGEMPLEEEFWRMARERQRETMKVLLEGALETEMVELVAAGRYRRNKKGGLGRPAHRAAGEDRSVDGGLPADSGDAPRLEEQYSEVISLLRDQNALLRRQIPPQPPAAESASSEAFIS